MKWYWWLAIGGLLFIILAVAGSWAWRYYTAPIEGRVGIQEQVQSKEYHIAAYDHFYDSYASIQALEAKLQINKDSLKEALGTKYEQTWRTNVAGVEGQLAEAKASVVDHAGTQ